MSSALFFGFMSEHKSMTGSRSVNETCGKLTPYNVLIIIETGFT